MTPSRSLPTQRVLLKSMPFNQFEWERPLTWLFLLQGAHAKIEPHAKRSRGEPGIPVLCPIFLVRFEWMVHQIRVGLVPAVDKMESAPFVGRGLEIRIKARQNTNLTPASRHRALARDLRYFFGLATPFPVFRACSPKLGLKKPREIHRLA